MISLVTNIDSMLAQQNLNVNSRVQSNAIQQLTSGYRINSSADDAAGLSVANGYRNQIAELNQGVLNANQSVSQLQIIDGGLSNVSQILDRMQTLATESASSTFTGNRETLNNEYSSLMSEIDRQAANIGLNSGGTYNTVLSTYIGGGGATQTNSEVTVDLSGTGNVVSSTGLGLGGTNLLSGGQDIGSYNTANAPGGLVLANSATETVTLNLASGAQHTVTITGSVGGITVANAVNQINAAFGNYGVTASIDSTNGFVEFGGNVGFTVTGGAGSGGNQGIFANAGADKGENSGMYRASNETTSGALGTKPQTAYGALGAGDTEALTFVSGGQSVTVNLAQANGATVGQAQTTLNTQLAALGIQAVLNTAGTGLDFYSANTFTVAGQASGAGKGVFGQAVAFGPETSIAPTSGSATTSNALSAVTAVTNAVSALGLVQGRVGAGENKMNYAINLAQSQITSFSSAQSQIRDANVAAEASVLTQAQVLQQSSIAAMAQANAEPQAVLALLQKL